LDWRRAVDVRGLETGQNPGDDGILFRSVWYAVVLIEKARHHAGLFYSFDDEGGLAPAFSKPLINSMNFLSQKSIPLVICWMPKPNNERHFR